MNGGIILAEGHPKCWTMRSNAQLIKSIGISKSIVNSSLFDGEREETQVSVVITCSVLHVILVNSKMKYR